MAKWTFLFSQLIHFLMKKIFSFFREYNFGAFGKVPPSCGSLSVYVDEEWAPRGYMTKREAINLAYAISISKNIKLEVSFR